MGGGSTGAWTYLGCGATSLVFRCPDGAVAKVMNPECVDEVLLECRQAGVAQTLAPDICLPGQPGVVNLDTRPLRAALAAAGIADKSPLVENEAPAIVMPWGGNTMEKTPIADLSAAAACMAALARGVAALHAADPPVFHADIKPENILVHPDTGAIALVDWGLSGSSMDDLVDSFTEKLHAYSYAFHGLDMPTFVCLRLAVDSARKRKKGLIGPVRALFTRAALPPTFAEVCAALLPLPWCNPDRTAALLMQPGVHAVKLMLRPDAPSKDACCAAFVRMVGMWACASAPAPLGAYAPAWAAVSGHAAGMRLDVHALGLTMHWMIAKLPGGWPVYGPLNPGLVALIAHMTDVDPWARPGAGEVAARLQALMPICAPN